MAKTRIMFDNLLDDSSVTLTAGSENTDLPASNILHAHRGRVYRTGTSTAAEWLKANLGSSKPVNCLIVLDHNLQQGDSAIKIQGNASDSWGSPSFEDDLTPLISYGEEFDNAAWSKGNATVTANQAIAPDGSLSADKIDFAAIANANLQSNTPTTDMTATYVYSIWLRADSTITNVKMAVNSGPAGQYTTGDQSTTITTEWQRFSFSFTVSGVTTDTYLIFYLLTRDAVASTIYAWGAQIDKASSLQPYNPIIEKGIIVHFFDSIQNYQWWRFIFTKDSASETRDIGRVFLGLYHELDKMPAFEGVEITPVDFSTTTKSLGGESYSEIKNVYNEINIEFKAISSTQLNLLKQLGASVGTHTPFFISIDPDRALKFLDWTYYVKARGLTGQKVKILSGGDYLYDASLKLEEQL